MNQVVEGRVGRALWLGTSLIAWAMAGCGSGSGTETTQPNMTATADCGSITQPKQLTISGLFPAIGSTVPNAGIVETFTIVGKLLQIPPSFYENAPHTAGKSIPETVGWTPTISGSDTVYTSQPISWTTTAHVELDPPLLVTTDQCVWTLPTPVFSYNLSTP